MGSEGARMKLGKIEVFCAVARNMSFSKAAEECRVAQSSISQQIRALEEELGFELFQRSTRKVCFTDAGQSFYVDCVKLLNGLDEALDRAASIVYGKKSFLTVGIEGLMQNEIKVEAIKKFAARYEDIRVIPKQVGRDEKYEQLIAGDIDVISIYRNTTHSIPASAPAASSKIPTASWSAGNTPWPGGRMCPKRNWRNTPRFGAESPRWRTM